jgi:uncharacterized protein YndB with AHSA1/START domain
MTTTTTELQVAHTYRHAPETVFDAWLDPARAAKFLFATPTGEMIRADIDARVGGRFNFTDRRPDMGDVEHVGEYVEIDRPRRLVFTFAVPKFDRTVTTVAVDFRAVAGGCEVTLTHTGVLPDWREQTTQGWTMILGALDSALV